MAEQRLSELVEHLIDWIESLHEKNLKYQAQVKTLSRDLAEAQNSNEQLEARLSAYQNHHVDDTKPAVITLPAHLPPQHIDKTPSLATNLHNSNLHNSDQITINELHTTQQNHNHHHQHHSQHQHQHQQQHPQLPPPPPLQHQQQHQHQHQHQHPQQQPQPQQQAPMYQQMHNPQTFVPQPQYVWTTYDTSGQVPYYEQYANTQVLGAPAAFQQPQ